MRPEYAREDANNSDDVFSDENLDNDDRDLKTLLETNVRQLESTFFLTWLSKCTCACLAGQGFFLRGHLLMLLL